MKSSHVCERTVVASVVAFGIGFAVTPVAVADDTVGDQSAPGPVVVTAVDPTDGATDSAVTACGAFAQVLDGSSTYYGDFADSFEGSDYADPSVDSSNSVGRTALRESASTAMQASALPGLDPAIANPMRMWSLGASALLVKMGLRIPGDSLNNTATQMNNQAEQVQMACAAAGTHA